MRSRKVPPVGRVERRRGGGHGAARVPPAAARPVRARARRAACSRAALDRLQQVVDGVQLERLDGELVEGGDERDRAAARRPSSSRAASRPPISGICRSSRARSGRRARSARSPPCRWRPRRRARRPRSGSAGWPGSGAPAARRRRARRAAASSGHPGSPARGGRRPAAQRQPHFGDRAAAGRRRQRQRGAVAVVAGQPLLDVVEADAARRAAVGDRGASGAPVLRTVTRRHLRARRPVVEPRFDAHRRRRASLGAMPCLTAFSTSGCSISDGIGSARSACGHVDARRAAAPRTARARSPGSARPARARGRAS